MSSAAKGWDIDWDALFKKQTRILVASPLLCCVEVP